MFIYNWCLQLFFLADKMIKFLLKLEVSYCELVVGVIGLSAKFLYFSTKKKVDGDEPAKIYCPNNSKNFTSARNI